MIIWLWHFPFLPLFLSPNISKRTSAQAGALQTMLNSSARDYFIRHDKMSHRIDVQWEHCETSSTWGGNSQWSCLTWRFSWRGASRSRFKPLLSGLRTWESSAIFFLRSSRSCLFLNHIFTRLGSWMFSTKANNSALPWSSSSLVSNQESSWCDLKVENSILSKPWLHGSWTPHNATSIEVLWIKARHDRSKERVIRKCN